MHKSLTATQRVADLQKAKNKILKTEIASLQASYTSVVWTSSSNSVCNKWWCRGFSSPRATQTDATNSCRTVRKATRTHSAEMLKTFAVSQDLQFKYRVLKTHLTGSLQDLAAAAEQLELAPAKAQPPSQTSGTKSCRVRIQTQHRNSPNNDFNQPQSKFAVC